MKNKDRPTDCPKYRGMLVHTMANAECLQCGWILEYNEPQDTPNKEISRKFVLITDSK